MPDLAAVRAWALVLDAEGIPNRIQPSDDGTWALVVDAPHAAAAAAALRAYEAENAPAPAIEAAGPRYGRTWLAVALATALVLFHLVTGGWDGGSRWFAAGGADAGRILAGEPWRAVTSLTLHADGLHVASNALSLALFGSALMSMIGPGVGLWVVLLSGSLGNLINAAVRGPGHGGVGASTAVFGIIGALAGLQFARHRWRERPGSAVTPLVAGALLLLLLGTGEQSDILAHLWGFVVGIAAGALYGRTVDLVPSRGAQWALTAVGLVAIAASWVLAMR